VQKLITILLTVGLLLISSGCLAILDPSQKVPVRTEPDSASVILNDKYMGSTPLVIKLPRNINEDSISLVIKKEGYLAFDTKIVRRFSWTRFLVCILESVTVFGPVIDFAFSWDYPLKEINLKLIKEDNMK